MKHELALRRIAQRIAAACDPELILLYGSFAKGQATVDSDVDLLVVVAGEARTRELAAELRELVDGLPVPVDLKVITKQRMEDRRQGPHGFLRSILSSGVMLYERS